MAAEWSDLLHLRYAVLSLVTQMKPNNKNGAHKLALPQWE